MCTEMPMCLKAPGDAPGWRSPMCAGLPLAAVISIWRVRRECNRYKQHFRNFIALFKSPLILSTVRFVLITRSGCSQKHNHRKETLNEKSISIVGILASDLTGPCLLPGTHKYVCFISRSLFQAAVTKCSVWTQSDTGKQIWSLEWLTQLSNRCARSYRSQDR